MATYSNLQQLWRKKLQISVGGILMWSLLLGQYGAEGQINVTIASEFLNLKSNSTLNVEIGSTQSYRIIWRKSSVSQNTLPTDKASILIQWATNGVTCPDGSPATNGICGKFGMNDDYGLIFNYVNLTDRDQKFWCQVSAEGAGNDNIVPKVCDSGSTTLPECQDNVCNCTATGFTPETNFTLRWLKNGERLQTTQPQPLTDGDYFTASSSVDTTKYGAGEYTCCTSGDAYFFENSQKICNSFNVLDPCSSSPCPNGGKCEVTKTGYQCRPTGCEKGYQGPNCNETASERNEETKTGTGAEGFPTWAIALIVAAGLFILIVIVIVVVKRDKIYARIKGN